ncbi:MFS transporter [Mumia sp. zg.B17]|uniref:MFS transporter n=1 Tax=Mumia sp. zg.B17 TaxID=2855446 RepID=UPI001C6E2AFD|nr:MFS transporter [Mumia sp. zg.B17]MBW9206918.1 MFS transporter [Mumia sp. zg.B17]
MHERVPTEHTAAQPSRSRARARDAAMLAVLCGAIFLEGIDLSMTAVALPSIRADLDMSTTGLQWVVSAYALGYGGFVLLGGRASDVLGRRRTFLTWLVVFLLFSGLGGVAVDGWMLVVSRFVTGVAAGFLTPAGLALVTTTFAEGPRRDRALLIYSGAAAGGFSLGMMAGGLLTAIDWRWVFFAPVIMSAVLLAGAVALVPRDERGDGSARERFDVRGTLTLTSAMLLVVLALVQSPQAPALRTVAVGVLGLALLGLFVALERRAPAPVVRLGILRSGRLVRANLAALLLVGAFVGFQFVMVLYLQELRGWSEVETGMAMAVLGLDAVLAPTVTPLLVARWGNTVVFLSGFVVAAVAYASLLRLGADWSYAALLPSFVLVSIAFALAYGPLTIEATNGVAAHEQGLAGGLLSTSFQFGSALGLAAVAVVLAAVSGPAATIGLDGFRAALLVPVVTALLGVAVSTVTLRRESGLRRD